MELLSEVGKLMRSIRGHDSLRKAGEKTGISHNYLSIVEKGVDPRSGAPIKPSPDTLKAFSAGYSYPYEDLMRAAGYVVEDDSVPYQRPYEAIAKEIALRYPGVDLNDPDVMRKIMKAIDLVLDDYEQKKQ